MPDSSPETAAVEETANLAAAPAEAKDVSAESSAATEGPESMLDAVKAALAPEAEKSPDSENDGSEGDAASAEAKAEEDEPLGDLTEEELSRYKPKTQRRVRQLIEERNSARAELETVKQKAQGFEQIETYVRANGLTELDVNTGFEIMALMTRDPKAALEKLTPIVQHLQQTVGAVLPTDIAEDMRLGYISEQRAYELSQARAQAAIKAQEAQRLAETQQREAAQRQTEAHIEAVASAVTSWEKAKSSTDPDWELKRSRIGELMELEVRRSGYPRTAQDAVKLAETALERVSSELRRYTPKTPVTPVVNASSSRSAAAPETMLDAIKQAIRA